MRTKLRAMESYCGSFQASHHDSVVYSSSSSVNGHVHLPRDVLPLSIPQTPCHTMADDLLPFSFATSPSLPGILSENIALISHHVLGNAKATSLFDPRSDQEQRAQAEQETGMLVCGLTACASHAAQGITDNNHHHVPFQSYAAAQLAEYLYSTSVVDDPYDKLLLQVQHDQQHNQIASENLLNIKNGLQIENFTSFMPNDAQDSNTASSFSRLTNGGCVRDPCLAPLTTSTSSSSSSTAPNMSSEQLTRLANQNLQAWISYESNSFKGKDDTLMNVRSEKMETVQDQAKRKRANPAQEPKKKRRKRRRLSYKNVEEMETQRMTHIAVERNRRKQMNDHLRALRLLMPQSYIQRGDQASIVGATIRFVEELQQVLQSLRLQKHLRCHQSRQSYKSSDAGVIVGEDTLLVIDNNEAYTDPQSCFTTVEVTMLASSTFFMRVEAQNSPHQLLHTLFVLSKLSLRVTHLNVSTMGIMSIFTFNLEADDGGFQLLTPLELAGLVKHMLCVQSMSKLREN